MELPSITEYQRQTLKKCCLKLNFFGQYSYLLSFSFFLQKILKLKEDFPAGRVRPDDGKLFWILDQPAAQKL